jgi:hypothetical protein
MPMGRTNVSASMDRRKTEKKNNETQTQKNMTSHKEQESLNTSLQIRNMQA